MSTKSAERADAGEPAESPEAAERAERADPVDVVELRADLLADSPESLEYPAPMTLAQSVAPRTSAGAVGTAATLELSRESREASWVCAAGWARRWWK